MSDKPTKTQNNQEPADKPKSGEGQGSENTKDSQEHHVPGADGAIGAEAEEDNNP